MPTLPITGPAPLDGGDLPVRSTDDVLALFPVEVRQREVAPVRDDIVAALTEIQQEYQRRAEQCAGSSDILAAGGVYLDGLTEDHGVYRQPGELDDGPRRRVLNLEATVTPESIIAAVNAILAPYTTSLAKYFEPNVDGWFVNDGTASWSSHMFVADPRTPRYPDRLYVDDAADNFGLTIESREPPGAWVSGGHLGREFILRLPSLGAIESYGSYVSANFSEDNSVISTPSFFVGDGSDTFGSESSGAIGMFVFESRSTSEDVYATIVSTVERLKGQSMRWQAIVDPLL